MSPSQDQLNEWVARLSYRPTWEIRAHVLDTSPCVLITVGSYGPCTLMPNTDVLPARYYHHNKKFLATRLPDIQAFADAVLETIEELETHEMLEYFRVDGKHWVRPHRDGEAIYKWQPN